MVSLEWIWDPLGWNVPQKGPIKVSIDDCHDREYTWLPCGNNSIRRPAEDEERNVDDGHFQGFQHRSLRRSQCSWFSIVAKEGGLSWTGFDSTTSPVGEQYEVDFFKTFATLIRCQQTGEDSTTKERNSCNSKISRAFSANKIVRLVLCLNFWFL